MIQYVFIFYYDQPRIISIANNFTVLWSNCLGIANERIFDLNEIMKVVFFVNHLVTYLQPLQEDLSAYSQCVGPEWVKEVIY